MRNVFNMGPRSRTLKRRRKWMSVCSWQQGLRGLETLTQPNTCLPCAWLEGCIHFHKALASVSVGLGQNQKEHRGTAFAITHSWMNVLRMKPAKIRTRFLENSGEKSKSHTVGVWTHGTNEKERVWIVLACLLGSKGYIKASSRQQQVLERNTDSPYRW